MTNDDRKYGSNTGSRAADGKFGAGNPGKPNGARHKATLAASIALGDTMVKLPACYAHERLWLRVRFGRSRPTEYHI